MRTAVTPGSRKTLAVTVVGVLTLVLAAIYAFVGGTLIYSGVRGTMTADEAAAQGWASTLRLVSGFVAGVGAMVLLQGILGLLAGVGVLGRRAWGRILALVLAVPVLLWGLLFLGVSDGNTSTIVIGVVQVVCGLLTLVVLLRNGDDFRRT
jgi:hypothetical protein